VAEVLFYHLQSQPLERVLPVLVGKCRERGWRVTIQTDDDGRVSALDDVLWTFAEDSFLAHGTAREPDAATQPVLLMTGTDNPNGSTVRVILDGAPSPDLSGYERAMILFDGNDPDQIAAERQRWRALKDAGHAVTYWQQDEGGRWVKRA
jgi:DNA polymerase III subunit chi